MKKGDMGLVKYILGIVSVVLALFNPLPGLVLGIIGLGIKSEKTREAKVGKLLCIIGIIVSIVILAVSIYLFVQQGASIFESFPTE